MITKHADDDDDDDEDVRIITEAGTLQSHLFLGDL